ncbi:MAG: hypothetical protein P1U35_12615 [Cycloclasticus sp.]|nr:hypothetical protein [Cycloclasticus sp.]
MASNTLGSSVPVANIDKQLHAERAVRGGAKVTYTEEFGKLPSGTFIEHNEEACLLWKGQLNSWSPDGYQQSASLPASGEIVTVLTPLSIVKIFMNGFMPQVHLKAKLGNHTS